MTRTEKPAIARWTTPEPGVSKLSVSGLSLLNINSLERMHWGAREAYRKRVAEVVALATSRPRPFAGRVHIVCCRAMTRGRKMDLDNLPSCFKAPIDALKLAGPRNPGGIGIIVDDSPTYVDVTFAQRPRADIECDWQLVIALATHVPSAANVGAPKP